MNLHVSVLEVYRRRTTSTSTRSRRSVRDPRSSIITIVLDLDLCIDLGLGLGTEVDVSDIATKIRST